MVACVQLAHGTCPRDAWGNMVTVITEKLRNQSLDDVKVDDLLNLNPSSTNSWSIAASGSSAFKFTGQRTWNLLLENKTRGASSDTIPVAKGTHDSLDTPPLCLHSKCKQSCILCDCIPSTPPAPPKKRHCRSLSIPCDGFQGRKWQPQTSVVWRPVALRPHLNNNKLLKNRNSPLGLHCHSHGRGSNSSPLAPLSQPAIPGIGIQTIPCNEHFSTPPESPSPIPRPASASSGYYDSSWSSLNSPWLETSPIRSSNKYDTFKYRSLSMEEQISANCVSSRTTEAGSMPVIPGSISSTPSSPRRQRVPRCRSQPCVLHDRKCGVKRRREDDRPSIDLMKMKETAYDRCGRRQKSIHAAQTIKSSRSLASLFSEPPEFFLGLKAIASSPLDSNLPGSLSGTLVPTPTISPDKEGAAVTTICPDTCSDSGCSDTNGDQAESESFVDADDSCSCHEPAESEEEQMFEIEMSNELDIEQIEKD